MLEGKVAILVPPVAAEAMAEMVVVATALAVVAAEAMAEMVAVAFLTRAAHSMALAGEADLAGMAGTLSCIPAVLPTVQEVLVVEEDFLPKEEMATDMAKMAKLAVPEEAAASAKEATAATVLLSLSTA